MEEYENPCVFKKVCRECSFCKSDSRPSMCIELACEHYTPCKKCGANRKLDDSKKCNLCLRKKDRVSDDLLSGRGRLSSNTAKKEDSLLDEDLEENLGSIVDNLTRSLSSKKREKKRDKYKDIKVTMPGTPPTEYSNEEKGYYLMQWKEYADFYSDPTVFPLIHNLIILEIELNYITFRILDTRSEMKESLAKRRTDVIRNIADLRKHLPTEDAMKMSEEESALSTIHDTYIKEAEKRNKGGFKKIFDLPTVALAPVLHFKSDLVELLERCGYEVKDIVELMANIKDRPEDPAELAKAFGFPVDKKYACEDNEEVDYNEYYEDDETINRKSI